MQKNSPSMFRIDDRVFTTMFIFFGLFSLILIYSYSVRKTCEVIDLTVSSTDFYVGSVITFKAEVKNGETYHWDFGDKISENKNIPIASHDYDKPGHYRVKLLVNGRCERRIDLLILERPMSLPMKPQILSPETAEKGRPVTFSDSTPGATKWEWFFDDSPALALQGKSVSHIFLTTGFKQVRLRINNDPELISSKEIFVTEKDESLPTKQKTKVEPIHIFPNIPLRPKGDSLKFFDEPKPTPAEQPRMAPPIEANEMEDLLIEVVRGTKTSKSFSRYLCNEEGLKVIYNKTEMTLGAMCNELARVKKVAKIERPIVTLEKNKNTGCLQSMIVDVEKKGFLERLTDKIRK